MASEPRTTPAQPAPSTSMNSDQPIVDLVIVSPSVGVPQPLRFPGTPASTTIKQLKGKIRDALALRPTEENQRLIHRGRALVRDGDTLLDIFGPDSIAADQQQTMHLVIRDLAPPAQPPTQSQHPSAPNTIARDPSPAPAFGAPAQAQAQAQAQRPSPQEQYLNMMQRRMMQGNRDAISQVLNQSQRGRAQMGMRGIGDTNHGPPAPIDGRDRRASPSPALHSFPQDHVTNTRTYRVESTVRMASNGSNGMFPADLQNVFQSADANQATLTMTNAMNNAINNVMQRSSSSASLHNRPLTQPGVTVPVYSSSGSRAGSGRTTPFGGLPAAPGNGPRPGQEVYILSSPEGPRALLVNNATAETYFTPRLPTRTTLPRMHNPVFSQMFSEIQRAPSTGLQHNHTHHPHPHPPHHTHHTHHTHPHPPLHPHYHPMQHPQSAFFDSLRPPAPQAPQTQNEHSHASPQPSPIPEAQPNHQPTHQQHQPQQPQAQGQQAIQAAMGHGLGHPQMHPPVAAIPPLLRMLWPHLWLILRLALFVWIFTSQGASWSRWMTIIGLAVFIFILSTGALNGLAEHIMRPVGRHLDHLLPALDGQNGRGRNAPRAAVGERGAVAAGPGGEPRPHELAERLLNERQARESWFTGQFRRVERASLLFLASIAPGVAERHIAHLEAEAARQRREAEEAAARAAAEAENRNAEDADGGPATVQDGVDTHAQEGESVGQTGQQRDEAAQGRQGEPNAVPEPLIAL